MPGRSDRYEQIEHALSDQIGARLRAAREAMGISQLDLGEMLGYAPTMISAFEKGRRRMKLEDLARACIALGKEPEFFLQTESMRRTAAVGMTMRAEVAALPHEELRDSLDAFLDQVGSDARAAPGAIPDLGHLRPEAAAREVLDIAGISEPPVQLEHICATLELPIYWRDDFPDALSAVVLTISDSSYAIAVNSHHSPKRRRFSIAHELGHAILRHEASYYLEYSLEDAGAGDPPGYRFTDEREANAFAAALLMDERWVRDDFVRGLRDVPSLARRYDVSEAAMGFRLTNLGLA